MTKTYQVRVHSYFRTRHLVGYVTLITLLFVAGSLAINSVQSYPATYKGWWYFDIPWILLSCVSWLPVVQMMRYRRTFLTVELDEAKRTCRLVSNAFAGEWRVRKNHPYRMTTAKAAAPILSLFILFMLVIGFLVLYHVWHVPLLQSNAISKVNAVQSLCTPVLLAGLLVPTWSFWKYPNLIVLRKPGKWLSAQFRDTV